MLLEIGRRLQRPLDLPWQTFDEMLAASFGALPSATPDVDAWTDAQGKGMWSGTLPAALARQSAAAVNAPAVAQRIEAPRFDGDAEQYPFHFLPYPSSTFLDGSLAHLPWLQEMPDPLTSAMWSSWVGDQSDDCSEARASARATSWRLRPRKERYAAPRSSRRALRPTSSPCRQDKDTGFLPATRAVVAQIPWSSSRR